ncbi:TIGR01777 family oxidoreductase [Salinisphaera japonica]|uniref:Epimerase n=1 Tax=Salinisphaera japonica YTM-1 TaxID=1209778 RepID=A0A423PWP6_9GAMM|nr:TIGR01777 family oxidoreductase [Salinisphaera japonica]ROO29999.1 epimerase [Salinisphaera japonica YTM-1]
MKNILITGGTGFVGTHLIPQLLDEGWAIEVLTRDKAAAEKTLPKPVVCIESLDKASQPQAIVNLAGENLADGRWTDAGKKEMRESRLSITRDLVAFIGACDTTPAVLVSGSAVGYYGARGTEVLDEEKAPGDEFQADLCRDWEAEALKAEAHGVRVCLIRTGIVLGAKDGALAQMITPFKFGLGGHFGSGEQYMPWIHIKDQTGAIRFLLDNDEARGPFNLAAPEPVTNQTFTDTLARVLHRPSFAWVPGPALKVAVGEMSHLLLTGQRAVPRKLQTLGYEFVFTDLEAAMADLVG